MQVIIYTAVTHQTTTSPLLAEEVLAEERLQKLVDPLVGEVDFKGGGELSLCLKRLVIGLQLFDRNHL